MKSTYDTLSKGELGETLIKEIKRTVVKDNVKKKIYFAGPWFSDKAQIMHASCRKIYNLVKKFSDYDVFFPNDFHSDDPEECFNNDVKEILSCDLIVASVDEKDVGTAWEIGMAFALGKPVYLLGFDETTFQRKTNLMLAYTGKSFTIDKWSKFLMNGLSDNDYINTDKNWEVIE